MSGDGGGTLSPTGWRIPLLLAVFGTLIGLLVANSVTGLPLLPWSAIAPVADRFAAREAAPPA